MAAAKFKPVEEQLAYLRKGVAEIIREDELKAKLEKSAKEEQAAARVSGRGSHRAGYSPWPHRGAAKAETVSGHGPHSDFPDRRFFGDDWRSDRTIGNAPATFTRASGRKREDLSRAGVQDSRPGENRGSLQQRMARETSPFEIVQLCGKYRLARMLEREDFRSRLDKNLPISVHELLYPLLTAYDAVALKSDIELGATEQKFNLLVHRDIQREYGLAGEVVLTMPILVGLDGERKMSKSLGNYVGITEAPGEMFGKLMSISDEQMWTYYELLTDFGSPVIVRLKEEVRTGVLHPKEAKMQLAHTIVAGFHGEDAARKAKDEFQRVFSERKLPSEIREHQVAAEGRIKLAKILQRDGGVASRAEADRLIKQGAVEIDGKPISDVAHEIDLSPASKFLVRIGKKPPFYVVVK